ncbi:MAG: (d)CMP kinase [Acidimicrobiia bacterium]
MSARVVAIDGPSGSGKSTVGRGVAAELGLHVLDTGAMYRSVTLAVLMARGDIRDPQVCGKIARDAQIELEDEVVRLNRRDVSAEIRGPEVTAAVSTVSAHPEVRNQLVGRQRSWVVEHGGGVVEGRDIGTVVFPDALVKVFLTASDEERANRRQRDEHAAARPTGVAEVRESLARRDALDSGRATSPLRAAPDALVVDTTGRTVADVVAQIVEQFRMNAREAT